MTEFLAESLERPSKDRMSYGILVDHESQKIFVTEKLCPLQFWQNRILSRNVLVHDCFSVDGHIW